MSLYARNAPSLTFWQPSIISLVHYDATNLSLELEYIGPDLSHFIDKQRMSQLSEELQHRIWIDISRGLEYIHTEGIFHLDIKPQNILLGKSGRAVLCDFGSSVKGAAKPISNNGGTPCYIPPEFLFDDQRGFPGDVWAFGVTMLFVFGLMALPRGNWKIADVTLDQSIHLKMVDWLRKIQQLGQDVPGNLSLLRAMLDMNAKTRITASQLAHDLIIKTKRKAFYDELFA